MGFALTRTPVRAIPVTIAFRRTVPWPLLLAGGWLLQVFVRLLLAGIHHMATVPPDETGYLMAARLLAGRDANDISGNRIYQGGYPLLISLAYRVSEDPATAYRIILFVNALIGALLFLLAYAALRRLEVTRGRAYLLATATGFLPSAVHHGQFAMTDAILPVVVLGWLLCVHSWLSHGGTGWAMAASGLAAYSFSVHNRGIIILVMHAVLLVVVLVRGWASENHVLAAAGVLVGGGAAGWGLNTWIVLRLYPQGYMVTEDMVRERLTSLDGWGWTLALATGKLWYLLAATLGFAGVGLIAAGAVALRAGTPPALRASAALLVGTTAGIALASSAATPDEGTVGNFAYGRYLACVAPALFLAGGAFALRGTRTGLRQAVLGTAILTPLCALVVWSYAGKRLTTGIFGLFDFPEMSALTWSFQGLKLGWATLAVLPGLLALMVLRHRRVGPLALAAVLAANGFVIAVGALRISPFREKFMYSATSLAPAGLNARDVVAMDPRGLQPHLILSHMFHVRSELKGFDRFKPMTLPKDATLVVVPWDGKHPAAQSWPTAPSDFSLVLARPAHMLNGRFLYTNAWAAWRRTR